MDDCGDATVFRLNHKYLPVAKETAITFEKLCREYTSCIEKKLPFIVTPTIDIVKDWANHVALSKAAAALDLAVKLYPHTTNIVCLQGPKSLVVDAAIKKGELTLVPATNRMKVVDGLTLGSAPQNFTCRVDGVAIELTPYIDNDDAVPVWFCNSTIDKKDVNLKFIMVTVDIDSAVGGEVHCKVKSTVDIPVLVNTRALKVGDELQYLAAHQKEGTKRPFDMI